MGAIYLGKKLGVGGFEKEVVLKQLLPEFTQQPKFIDLFLREARLSASLEHANIVHTIDLVNAGDDYFMVMEYVKGADLRTLLKRVRRKHKRFSAHAGVFIGHEILEALAYAHQKSAHDGRPLNLIHRDISPSNILLSGAGEVKLTDFGIAKASTHRSVFYKVKGKVGYMSPEQARGEPVDARSDLFSLGVVLYEVLVGERLFVGDIMSSASQIYAQPIQPPSRKRPEIPGELDAVILKALSLDPAGRFQSAEEFQETLTRVATRHRLLVGASEMSAHLKSIAGEDAAMWLRLEAMGPHGDRGEPTQTHGTAVLSTQGIVEGEDERKSEFDLSDAEEERGRGQRRRRPVALAQPSAQPAHGRADLGHRRAQEAGPRRERLAEPGARGRAAAAGAAAAALGADRGAGRIVVGAAAGRPDALPACSATTSHGSRRWCARAARRATGWRGRAVARRRRRRRGGCDQAASAVASRLRALARSCRRDVEPARRLAAVRQLAAVRSDGICGHGGRGAPLADVGDPAEAARPAVRRRGLRAPPAPHHRHHDRAVADRHRCRARRRLQRPRARRRRSHGGGAVVGRIAVGYLAVRHLAVGSMAPSAVSPSGTATGGSAVRQPPPPVELPGPPGSP